jgi:hypothetical protein
MLKGSFARPISEADFAFYLFIRKPYSDAKSDQRVNEPLILMDRFFCGRSKTTTTSPLLTKMTSQRFSKSRIEKINVGEPKQPENDLL